MPWTPCGGRTRRSPAPANAGEDLGAIPELASIRPCAKPAGTVGPAYEVKFATASGDRCAATMLPFTNIGRWYRADRPKPDRNAAASSYAIWFQSQDSPAFQERAKLAAERERALANAVDCIEPGNPESEQSHKVAGRRYRRASWTAGSATARISSMKCALPPGRDGTLVVTLWGGDVGREFDIFADEQLLGTQKLQSNQPGAFFEEKFKVPASLIQGRTDNFGRPVDSVTIRFKTKNSDVAGGIFGLRME